MDVSRTTKSILVSILLVAMLGPISCNSAGLNVLPRGYYSPRTFDTMLERYSNVVEDRLPIGGKVVHYWHDRSRPIEAVFICIHGLGLSSVDYEDFARFVASESNAVYALNICGFGPASEREEKPKLNFACTVNHICSILAFVKARHPNTPVILLGESLGGTVALECAAKFPDRFDVLVCSVPTWRFHGESTITSKALLGLLLGKKKRVSMVSHPLVQRATSDQTLRDHWLRSEDHRLDLSISEACNVMSYMAKAPINARKIEHMPVIFVQGIQDKLGDADDVATLFRYIKSKEKIFMIDGSEEHVIFEEGRFSDNSAFVLLKQLKAFREKRADGVRGVVLNEDSMTASEREYRNQLLQEAGIVPSAVHSADGKK